MTTKSEPSKGGGGSKGYRRRQYVINPKLQWRFAAMIGLTVFVMTFIASAILFTVLYNHARARVISPEASLTSLGTMVFVFAAIFALLSAGALGLWTVLFTHRICGPLYVLQGYFVELTNGLFPRPRPLRKKDEIKEFYDLFARTVDSLRSRKQQQLNALARALHTAAAADPDDLPSCRAALDQVINELEPIRGEAANALGVPPTIEAKPTEKASPRPAPAGVS